MKTNLRKRSGSRFWTSLALGLGISIAWIAFGLGVSTASAATNLLRVGVSPTFPPMVFKQGRELAGVEVDLARALGEHLGREVKFIELPWADQIEALNAGRTDIIMSSMSITTARKFVVNFSEPYFVIGQMALVRRVDQNQYALGFPLDPKGAIGVIKATTGEFQVQQNFPKAKRKVFADPDKAAKALVKKKIDLFVCDSPVVWYMAAAHAADGLSVVPIMLSQEPLGWAVRKSDENLLGSVNEFLNQAKQDGRLLKTFRRWMAVGN